ncbi:MAG: TraI domain-containing protein [Chania sp.]
MLKSLLKLLPVSSANAIKGSAQAAISLALNPSPEGYLTPMSASELLVLPRRQQWLQMLWDYSSLPKDLYQQYYLQPLERCITLMQQFPATENGHHAYLGGMVDHLLETVAYAARLSKNYLLPVGAQPEEQASQNAAWNAVIVYAAMLQSLDGLGQIEVELESGKRWIPLNAAPGEPYRFRFLPAADTSQRQSQSAMLAWKVIPDPALLWLATWPEVLKTLSLYLTGFRHESGIINTIVLDAISASIGKSAPTGVVAPLLTPILPATPGTILSDLATAPEYSPPQSPSTTHSVERLASSLDSAVIDSTFGEADAKAVQLEDVTGDLLAVMGFSDSTHQVGEWGLAEAAIEDNVRSAPVDIGERFWQWLCEGCYSGALAVNTANARVHIIAGYVFIRAPNIFHQFLLEHKEITDDKAALQNAFERLGRHRQNNGAMYTCRIYQSEAREGRFQRMTGYLIIARKLYKDQNIPEDNPLLIIKP